jgi:hypothetical protein
MLALSFRASLPTRRGRDTGLSGNRHQLAWLPWFKPQKLASRSGSMSANSSLRK